MVGGAQVIRLLPGEHPGLAMKAADGERAVALYGSDGGEGDWLAGEAVLIGEAGGSAGAGAG